MRWTRPRFQTVTTWVVVVAWAVFYAVALATADPLPPAETALAQLVVPPLLLVVAARLVLRHWWSGPGSPDVHDRPAGAVAGGRGGGAARTPARVGR
jgi:hypothetical protein